MKILLILALVVISAIAEPPVDNRYLPPNQGFNSGSFEPSPSYGPPGAGRNEPQRQTDAVFRPRPSSTYGAPNRNSRPSSQYIPPSSPSSQYGPPARPSSTYGAPGSGSQGRQGARPPSTQYGVPGLRAPSPQYGTPSGNAPSQQYGPPGFGGGQGSNSGGFNDFGAQNRAYLPPGQGRGDYAGSNDDGSNGEPANYNFEYMVKDEESGNDFGHRESRQGDRAEGLYYVLLPDGRKQTVEYEADQNGYRPKISYEDVGTAGGFGGRGQGYQNGGYQNGGYQNGGQLNGGPY